MCMDDENCSVHFRKDMSEFDTEDCMAITYVGEYAVVTDLSPMAFMSPDMLAQLESKVGPVPLWRTSVLHVGDGAIASDDLSDDEESDLRWRERYWDFDKVENGHKMISECVGTAMLDLEHRMF